MRQTVRLPMHGFSNVYFIEHNFGLFCFLVLFCFVLFCFEAGSLCVAQAALKLTILPHSAS
jgi:hypothetical protein